MSFNAAIALGLGPRAPSFDDSFMIRETPSISDSPPT